MKGERIRGRVGRGARGRDSEGRLRWREREKCRECEGDEWGEGEGG